MPTRYTKTCIPQYCRYHTEWPKEAILPAQFQGVQKGHVDASQDTVGVRHARDVAQDQQYLAGDGQQPADGQQKDSGAAHQQELRLAEDQLPLLLLLQVPEVVLVHHPVGPLLVEVLVGV